MKTARLERLRKLMTEKGLDGFLVSSPVNCFYLTNFEKPHGDFRAIELLITADDVCLFTNPLYQGSVKNWLKSSQRTLLAERQGESLKRLPAKIIVTSVQRGLVDHLTQLCQEKGLKIVGFEENDLKLGEYQKLEKKLTAVKFIAADSLFSLLRQIKDREEITAIREACRISDLAFEHILKLIKPGLSESIVALEIDYSLRKNGAEESAFETIVASGPNSAVPHHKTSDRKIKNGEILLLDFGARFRGYCSDMSRTVFVGQPKDEEIEAYEAAVAAQELALKGIHVAMTGGEADSLARNYLKKSNLDKYFIHNLGHNLGLDIHEPPSLGPRAQEELREGTVFSVEPGLYFPGRFGIRIEDTVTIQNGQLETLTHSEKKLLQL